MSVLINLNTTAASLAGGADAATGTGEDWKLTIGGTWAVGDKATLILTDGQTGLQTQIGAGTITGITPNYCYTYNNKVYMLAGDTVYFSAVGLPTTFNDPTAAGNSFITMSDWFASPVTLTAMAPYQGSLLFTSRNTTQIWAVDPDPSQYNQTQVLPNIGTIAPESVQPVGDMDVYMLADNGFRSVRVRVASNNAEIADVGVPIDAIIQPLLASLTDVQRAKACGVVDPQANRYWCYIPKPDGSAGLIYVFSRFQTGEIEAWATYAPTYETVTVPDSGDHLWTALMVGQKYCWTPGTHKSTFTCGATVFAPRSGGAFTCANANASAIVQTGGDPQDGTLSLVTSFVPVKFGIYKGQVWVRDSNGNIYQYGGTDNNTYSACGISGILPYMDSGTPATKKTYSALDAAFEGSWEIGFSPDYELKKYKAIYTNTQPSFKLSRIPIGSTATHYSLNFQEFGLGYARFSSAVVHQQTAGEK